MIIWDILVTKKLWISYLGFELEPLKAVPQILVIKNRHARVMQMRVVNMSGHKIRHAH